MLTLIALLQSSEGYLTLSKLCKAQRGRERLLVRETRKREVVVKNSNNEALSGLRVASGVMLAFAFFLIAAADKPARPSLAEMAEAIAAKKHANNFFTGDDNVDIDNTPRNKLMHDCVQLSFLLRFGFSAFASTCVQRISFQRSSAS